MSEQNSERRSVSPVSIIEKIPAEREKELIERAKHDDIVAFEELIAGHQRTVYNFALYLTNDKVLAQDIAQEALVKVFRSLKSFRGDCPFTTWIYRVVRNVFLDELRRAHNKHKNEHVPFEELHNVVTAQAKPGRSDEEDAQLLRQVLHEAMRKLPTDMRTPLVMYELQGFSYEEISQVEGVAVNTIKSRIFRARQYLTQDASLRECWAQLT